ncbi:hypothetical protein ACHAXS_013868 [Conticribra weissflogii]
MKHFVFGYGSLICSQSRAVTAPTLKDAVAEPVVIRNIERTWSARVVREPAPESPPTKTNAHPSRRSDASHAVQVVNREHVEGWTPMGVRFRRGAKCNGVLIHVDDEELARFDIREGGYGRHKIDCVDIFHHLEYSNQEDEQLSPQPVCALDKVQCNECRILLEKASEKRFKQAIGDTIDADVVSSDISVWVYMQSVDLPPNPSFPITQSYVDIIMRGCLQISHDFAHMFLQTTKGWWQDKQQKTDERSGAENEEDAYQSPQVEKNGNSHHIWVDDRHAPMYVRADRQFSFEKGAEIDNLIEKHHPNALKRRVLSL